MESRQIKPALKRFHPICSRHLHSLPSRDICFLLACSALLSSPPIRSGHLLGLQRCSSDGGTKLRARHGFDGGGNRRRDVASATARWRAYSPASPLPTPFLAHWCCSLPRLRQVADFLACADRVSTTAWTSSQGSGWASDQILKAISNGYMVHMAYLIINHVEIKCCVQSMKL